MSLKAMLDKWAAYDIRGVPTSTLLRRRTMVLNGAAPEGPHRKMWDAAMAAIDAELDARIPARLVINRTIPAETSREDDWRMVEAANALMRENSNGRWGLDHESHSDAVVHVQNAAGLSRGEVWSDERARAAIATWSQRRAK